MDSFVCAAEPLVGGTVGRIVAALRRLSDISSQESSGAGEIRSPQNEADSPVVIQSGVLRIHLRCSIYGPVDITDVLLLHEKLRSLHIAIDGFSRRIDNLRIFRFSFFRLFLRCKESAPCEMAFDRIEPGY